MQQLWLQQAAMQQQLWLQRAAVQLAGGRMLKQLHAWMAAAQRHVHCCSCWLLQGVRANCCDALLLTHG